MKDTIMTLRNLRKDILCIQVPAEYTHPQTVKIVRDEVLAVIDSTIKRKE